MLASAAWKSTGKPPGVYEHIHNLADVLIYQDICGPIGSDTRQCNMVGNVISVGNHDRSEAAGGEFGSPFQELTSGIISPTVNLVAPGPTTPHAMDITVNAAMATEDYYIWYDTYSGIFDLDNLGNAHQPIFQSYPATQADGTKCWGEPRAWSYLWYWPDKQCFPVWAGVRAVGLLRTSNANGVPEN